MTWGKRARTLHGKRQGLPHALASSLLYPPVMDDVDWTGIAPRREAIRPLDAQTFLERIQRLSERARSIEEMRLALGADPCAQEDDGSRLSPNPGEASRSPG